METDIEAEELDALEEEENLEKDQNAIVKIFYYFNIANLF